MIQVLGLRPYVNKRGVEEKREVFFNNGWRFNSPDEVFNNDTLQAVLNRIPEDERYNLYFTVADCFEERGRKLKEQWLIPFDVDDIDVGDAPLDAAHAVATTIAEALGVPFLECASVFSGNGVQFFIKTMAPIVDEGDFDRYRVQYGVLADRIGRLLDAKGIAGKVDKSVWSKGRLMRLPNTDNVKKNKPRRTAHIINGTLVPQDFSLVERSGVVHVSNHEHISDEVLKVYPPPDTKSVLNECKFLSWCKEKPSEVTEPQWYAMVSITARLKDGADITHEFSQGHPDYTHYETDNKIEQALASAGPRTCANIDSLWGNCNGCTWKDRITSPIMIKGDEYIASRDFGFRRVILKNNKRVAGPPEYQDLILEFLQERPYKVVIDSDQVIAYTGTHWVYVSDRELKAWVTTKVDPAPSGTEMTEFLHQLKARHTVKLDDLHYSNQGYMNFSNGVLNIATRELKPHAPTNGFFQTLPFPYDAHATAPKFMQFITDITLGDEVKRETILEYLGYCISGDSCWLQKALFLIGDGANGKSVLMEIMGELVGSESHTAIPIQQLEKDTMRHRLMNKLFNYSEETSVRALEDSSTFKTVVSGGMMTVKQLYVQPFMVKNYTKFIISANDALSTDDDSYGMTRRILVLPLLATFKPGDGKHDPYIKDKLKQELSGICNVLLGHYEELKKRRVLKYEEELDEMTEEFQTQTSSIRQFIQDGLVIDVTSDKRASTQDVYDAYLKFCMSNGFKPSTKTKLSRLLAMRGIRSIPQRQGNKVVRHYIGITAILEGDI